MVFFFFFSIYMYIRFRVTGEEWLVKKPGEYLPGVFEEVSMKQVIFSFVAHEN